MANLHSSPLGLGLGILLAAGAVSCEGGSQVLVKYAPEFTPGHSTVAVFGVFQAGRMSPEAWYPLQARVSAAFGDKSCPVGFGDALKRADAELYSKLDQDVAENGIAEEILESVAAKTDADVIVTLSVHGRVEKTKAPTVGEDPSLPQSNRRPGASGGQRRRQRGGQSVTWQGLEMSASLYSVKLHHAVGRITLLYAGTNVDEAVTLFANKLATELPGSTCRPWSWSKAP